MITVMSNQQGKKPDAKEGTVFVVHLHDFISS